MIVRRLRLVSGLVLMAFVASHLVNHALGLISLHAMEVGQTVFLAVWRNLPATVVLYGALLIHFALSLWAVYARRSLRMPLWEVAQLLLGLAIVPLLALHILGTRFLAEVYGLIDTYTYEMLVLWVFEPVYGIKQVVITIIVWLHGCIGMHFWLKLKPWYPKARQSLFALALLVPVFSLLGFSQAGREIAKLAADEVWLQHIVKELNFVGPDVVELVLFVDNVITAVFFGLLALVLGARGVRHYLARQRGVTRISYPEGRMVDIEPGLTILEASRQGNIPHASVCGGRGRCSTCRVRIDSGIDTLPDASADEMRVLNRVGAPPGVRLACQTRPTEDIAITPLLPPTATAPDGFQRPKHLQGSEQEIAILFADMRAFTRMSEGKLPYDVVFVLNRYFGAMGGAVEDAGGKLDKFIGDGVMALFGIDDGPEAGCRKAIAAARGMILQLDELNKALANDLDQPLRIGIGIHCGSAIVGEMGYSQATSVTAVGDSVNTASRLEALSKEFTAELLISQHAVERAGLDLGPFPTEQVEIRGRREPLEIRVVKDARALPAA